MSRHRQVVPFQTLARIRNCSWYEPARRAFWLHPNRLMAGKATIAMVLLTIPVVLMGKPFFAVSLALGVLTGALSETDDHPTGRIKSLAIKVISFGFSSLAVELLHPWPVLLGAGLALSTVFFILIGGLGERYRGITFGTILAGIYTMIGSEISPAWYWQPILLTSGALFYGLLSLGLLYLHPWRLLEEQLARGYFALAGYLEEKARLFPSEEKMQGKIRNRLAMLNVELVGSLERCKDVLNSYRDSLQEQSRLAPYFHRFMLLQSLHERAASSHERYDRLSRDQENRQLMEGIGQLLSQQADACRHFARCLLTGVRFHHPASLEWTVKAVRDQLEKYGTSCKHPLTLLVDNLSRINHTLQQLGIQPSGGASVPRLDKDRRPLGKRMRELLNPDHPKLRYAVRLSLCLLAGFFISEGFKLNHGEWIVLTGLFVCQPSYSETRRRLFERILGTISGVVGGVLIVRLLPTIAGQLVLMLLSAYLFFLWLRRNYAVSVIFITIFILCAFNLISSQGTAVMVPRLIDTLLGSGLAILSVRFLWPDWKDRKLPGLLRQTLMQNVHYYEAIVKEYQASSADDLEYRIVRRKAHQADNALVLAWQDMQVEPVRDREFRTRAFTLTYLNHAMLSYLSALGAHRHAGSSIHPAMPALGQALKQMSGQTPSAEHSADTPLAPVIEKIRQAMQEKLPGGERQQLQLLFHIAEVSVQLLDLSRSLPPEEKQPVAVAGT
ncbi:MAG: YccS family putative transporter [Mangrovibacterium sp.]